MVPDWLVGIGSALVGVAAIWTTFQQRTINRHEREIKKLKGQSDGDD